MSAAPVGHDDYSARLFRLEHSRTHEEVKDAVDALIARLPNDAQSSLRHAFSVWLNDSIMPRVQGGPIGTVKNLKEIRSMLSETIQRWKMEFKREGRKEGRKRGLEEGRREGRTEGRTEGLREGKEQSLLRLLEKRFGALPDRAQRRIRGARLEELDAWIEEVLDVQSLDALIKNKGARGRVRTP